MAESLRKRRSKWDLIVEPQVTINLADNLEANDPGKDCASNSGWNSSKYDTETSFLPSEMNADRTMVNNESSEADKLTERLQKEYANIIVSNSDSNSDWNCSKYDISTFSLPSEMNADPAKMRDASFTTHKLTECLREDDKIEIPIALSPSSHFSKLCDTNAGDRDNVKPPYSEPSSGDLAAAEDEDFNRIRERHAKAPERHYVAVLSPGRDAWRQQSPTISPKRSWRRSQRSRSRSRSRGRSRSRSPPSYGLRRGPERNRSPSRSPPHGSRWGPEKRPDRDRMGRGLGAQYRDSAAGRGRRDNEFKSLHEDGARRQANRYYDRGTADTRESRYPREPADYPRNRFSTTDRPRCYDFTRGRCHRGSECRYAHHESSYDGGRGARESAERTHRVIKDAPCKFFTEGCCRRGEACSFSHIILGPRDDNSSKMGDSGFRPEHPQSNVQESNICRTLPQDAINHLAASAVPAQNQYAISQPIQAQSFMPNVQIPQLAPPMPLNAQMQQSIYSLPQIGPGQFIAPQVTPTFNIPMQNLPVLPPVLPPSHIELNQQNFNLPQPSQIGNQQNFILSGQMQQNLPLPPVNGQNLPLPPVNGQNQLNFNFDQPNQNMALQPPNPHIFNPNEQLMHIADVSEKQPTPQLNSDTPIIQKVVTSEQAAQITNISASLAQFFGSAGALNSQISAGAVPFIQPDQDPPIKEAQIDADDSVPNKIVDLEVKVQHGIEDIAAVTGVSETKTGDQKEQGDNVEDDNKQGKDAKGTRVFKCALVDFVKDVLKPNWKEGQLSREAHKTIVKKVVDKVTGAMQSQNIPQTQEKIDLYLSHSKGKLTKLVQAYVEKYVKA